MFPISSTPFTTSALYAISIPIATPALPMTPTPPTTPTIPTPPVTPLPPSSLTPPTTSIPPTTSVSHMQDSVIHKSSQSIPCIQKAHTIYNNNNTQALLVQLYCNNFHQFIEDKARFYDLMRVKFREKYGINVKVKGFIQRRDGKRQAQL
ncbi:hypothetical protein HOY82DRAFT_538137 [Tuber indicum]|nr:hypothetical protein HOY82DRAFT_538137 [Tuber indicum]